MVRPRLALPALLLVLPLAAVAAAVPTATLGLRSGAPAGEPLEVSGVVYEKDGRTPASGTKVFAYHTDARGLYAEDGQDRRRARHSGSVTTGRDGAYRFRTIWPGPYPGGQVPRHVHFELTARGGGRSSIELRFTNDPLLPEREREDARAAARRGDRFQPVQAADKAGDGVRRARFDLRLP